LKFEIGYSHMLKNGSAVIPIVSQK